MILIFRNILFKNKNKLFINEYVFDTNFFSLEFENIFLYYYINLIKAISVGRVSFKIEA